jgi:DNA repair protein RecN (Recombination protein N)
MLAALSIRNYAIIEELDIDFSNRMNVITGETGAGKSIIVGALGLILGERADSSVLVHKERKLVVEGMFKDAYSPAVKELFATMDWEEEADLVIRREISSQGKSRAFVNDSPVTLAQLQQLSSLLVDLHGRTIAAGTAIQSAISSMAGSPASTGRPAKTKAGI